MSDSALLNIRTLTAAERTTLLKDVPLDAIGETFTDIKGAFTFRKDGVEHLVLDLRDGTSKLMDLAPVADFI